MAGVRLTRWGFHSIATLRGMLGDVNKKMAWFSLGIKEPEPPTVRKNVKLCLIPGEDSSPILSEAPSTTN